MSVTETEKEQAVKEQAVKEQAVKEQTEAEDTAQAAKDSIQDTDYQDAYIEIPSDYFQMPKVRSLPKRMVRSAVRSVWFWLILLFPLGLIVREVFHHISGAADFYRDHIYRYLSQFFNNITGALPFSAGEMIVLLIPVCVVFYLGFTLAGIIYHKGQRLKRMLKLFVRPIGIACLAFFLYVTNCGINYFASDFRAMTNLTFTPPESQELQQVCVYLADQAADCRSRLEENSKGVVWYDEQETAEKAREAVNRLSDEYGFLYECGGLPKSLLLSKGMSYLNLTGVFFPWTFEANVNTDIKDYTMPFTMCHELSHLRGMMHEEDANFLAYLACIGSKDDGLRYAGYLSALNYLSRYLYLADETLYDEYLDHLTDGMLRDIIAHRDYWSHFETPVAKVAAKVNDSYLKTNAQPQGVRSYGKVAELILAHFHQTILPTLNRDDNS